MGNALYDDGVYTVTPAIVSTPRRFYPVANTSAHIRRDPLWAALALTAFSAAGLSAYGDLLHMNEQIVVVCLSGLGLATGASFSILKISAIGHASATIVGRSWRMARLYQAIWEARTLDFPVQIIDADNR